MRPPLFVFCSLMAIAACGSTTAPAAAKAGVGGTGTGGTGTGTGPVAGVSIMEFAFSPANETVKAGTTVRWENTGALAHTVTSDSGAFASGQLASASGAGGYGGATGGGTYQGTFNTVGTYGYHCANHPQMTGTVTVVP